LIKKIRPDIVHAHYISHFGILAGLYGWLSGFKPIVLTAWGSDILIDPKGFKKSLVKYALKKADCVTCDAEHMIEELIGLGTDPKKIEHMYFGTDIQKFNPRQKSEKLGEKLGVLNSPTIISIRSLKPIYDVGSLITAISRVLKEIPETKFVIAGSGSQEAELKQLAKSLRVSDSIRFVGFITNDELPEYLASADIYVSTSLSDAGIAASTAEAMACGLPVVITDFGDNRKWVEDGVNGFIVPLKDPKSLAERIIYLLKNPDIRKEFGMRNRKIINERNNYYKEMEKMENIYIDLVERYKS
jgi:glycosyltransferase involved in cell wall biosynthesis